MDRGHAGRLAVLAEFADEPLQLGPAGDVALDELDVVVVVVVVVGDVMTATRPAMRWALAEGSAEAVHLRPSSKQLAQDDAH